MTTVLFQNLAQVELQQLLASIGQEKPLDPQYNPDGSGGDDDDDDDDDPDEEPPTDEEEGGADGSCFVATACYGGAWHPDVEWLRGYRDTVLQASLPGRIFIAIYWQVGPILAKFVPYHSRQGQLLRNGLGAIVRLGRRRWPHWASRPSASL